MSYPILYLASASPRRHEILTQLDISHLVLQLPDPEGDDEPQLPQESPQDYVIRTARDKALRAATWMQYANAGEIDRYVTATHLDSRAHKANTPATIAREGDRQEADVYILSADTTVILNNRVLGKPTDIADAKGMLEALSGKTHHVHTAIALYHDGQLSQAVSISEVQFKNLSRAEIERYCGTGEPFGKAGSYGIQGRAGAFVSHLSGSYSGVMGLPAYETQQLLTEHGFFESGS